MVRHRHRVLRGPDENNYHWLPWIATPLDLQVEGLLEVLWVFWLARDRHVSSAIPMRTARIDTKNVSQRPRGPFCPSDQAPKRNVTAKKATASAKEPTMDMAMTNMVA